VTFWNHVSQGRPQSTQSNGLTQPSPAPAGVFANSSPGLGCQGGLASAGTVSPSLLHFCLHLLLSRKHKIDPRAFSSFSYLLNSQIPCPHSPQVAQPTQFGEGPPVVVQCFLDESGKLLVTISSGHDQPGPPAHLTDQGTSRPWIGTRILREQGPLDR
jgi:hypothetical protein